MKIIRSSLREVKIISPDRHGDDRGWFQETFSEQWFRKNISDIRFVQDNHSKSAESGTLRGLHFQMPPNAQGKLVRCVAGKIWDVAVDIRKNSADYGKWAAAELTPENGQQLFIPAGFAHGFLTLLPNTEVVYKCTDYYAPQSDGGIAWDDLNISLPWPLFGKEPTLSAKDRGLPRLVDLVNPF